MSRDPGTSNIKSNCISHKTLNVALALFLGGAASLAVAQSPKESFADTFATMQSLSSNSSNWQQHKPIFSQAARTRTAKFSLRDMQALSSDSPVWQIDHGKVEFDRGPTFAQTHANGLSFSQYQAYNSDSEEFALPPGADSSRFAGSGSVNLAGRNARPTFRR
jgi:hypothetical protein